MFTTKYMKNQPKAKKQRVRKFSEGGPVQGLGDAAQEADEDTRDPFASISRRDETNYNNFSKARDNADVRTRYNRGTSK